MNNPAEAISSREALNIALEESTLENILGSHDVIHEDV